MAQQLGGRRRWLAVLLKRLHVVPLSSAGLFSEF